MAFTHLTSKQRKIVEKSIAKENANFGTEFVELTNIPSRPGMTPPLKVWRSRRFLAQLHSDNGALRLSVNRTTLDSKGDWLAGISWDELQAIKNTLGFAEYDAVEIYPAIADEVNISNIRHLWIAREKLPFGWRADNIKNFVEDTIKENERKSPTIHS